jgi:APA family basic amino acid/polyamine antiporter
VLIVIGGIIGTGIFVNPSVVAGIVHTTPLILGVWIFGGLIALIGAFIFAEMAWRRPSVGGTYGYLREAFHPALAFMSGWTSLLVSNSGGLAATAMVFGLYVAPYVHLPVTLVAVGVIVVLTGINCSGVREGVGTQNLLMVLKIAAIGGLILAGFFGPREVAHATAAVAAHGFTLAAVIGAALIPVFYAYDGWQTAPFMDEELKDPGRSLPFGLIWGVVGVVALYVAVTLAGVHMLGPAGLAATTQAATVMAKLAVGPIGGAIMAGFVALSTLGFLSNTILVIPRLYFAMAVDGDFFKLFAYVHPKTRVPIFAILLQSCAATAILLLGTYSQILNYVTSMDFLFMAIFAVAIFVFRRRGFGAGRSGVKVPLHPWSTIFFGAVSAAVVVNSYVVDPRHTLVGLAILLIGAPVYFVWRRLNPRVVTSATA